MGLKITGLKTGYITNCYHNDLVFMADLRRKPTLVDIICPSWYITGGEKKILVDTGFKSVEWYRTHITESPKYFGWEIATRSSEEELLWGLKEVGAKPEDIDIVVNTHLHYDHCAQNYLFKNAEFIVQREEYKCAFDPFTRQNWHNVAYANPIAFPNEMPPFWGTEFKFIEGDVEIADGVKCIRLPGHTLGLQGVLVNTDKGDFLLPGDHFPLYENWEKRVSHGYCMDYAVWYRSWDKVKALGAKVIAHHDKINFEKENFPSWG